MFWLNNQVGLGRSNRSSWCVWWQPGPCFSSYSWKGFVLIVVLFLDRVVGIFARSLQHDWTLRFYIVTWMGKYGHDLAKCTHLVSNMRPAKTLAVWFHFMSHFCKNICWGFLFVEAVSQVCLSAPAQDEQQGQKKSEEALWEAPGAEGKQEGAFIDSHDCFNFGAGWVISRKRITKLKWQLKR